MKPVPVPGVLTLATTWTQHVNVYPACKVLSVPLALLILCTTALVLPSVFVSFVGHFILVFHLTFCTFIYFNALPALSAITIVKLALFLKLNQIHAQAMSHVPALSVSSFVL